MENEIFYRLMEYNFCAKQFMDLMNARATFGMQLKKKPKDVQIQFNIAKIDNDMKALTPILQGAGATVLDHLEKQYGVKFKFLKESSDDIVQKAHDKAVMKKSK